MGVVIRHLLAPHWPRAADDLSVARALPGAAGAILSFDDGPHPEGTPAVLEILGAADARAIFFVVGEQVQRRPALAAEIAACGHAIGVHGFRHHLELRMSPRTVRADIERAVATIGEAAGVEPSWHRPPYGIYSEAALRFVRDHGLTPLLWSRWGKDWRKFTTPSRIAARATREVAAGDVILLHDADFYSASGSHTRTIRALPAILAELERRKVSTVLPV
jgi:peptidoglycan/xylan/chitin deacetylase (PgdA/CDA1 family)